MSLIRVREHVNPLALKYQQPTEIPHWESVYADLSRPLHLDIGCAKGRFLQKMAQSDPTWNYLGLEIRSPLVEHANEWRDEQGLKNLHFLACNANKTLRPLLQSLPPGQLQRVTIQFPDPWFKKKHHKRRVVQPPLVQDLAELMTPGTEVFIQSDVLEVAEEMRDRFGNHPAFELSSIDWLETNPMPIPTERELATLRDGDPVYRLLLKHR
ncbi:tRNA (guanosine(46)-N7)-methyltransferase TrmB [Alkalinema pantanalense CENA528]|uniref:tRNA (guanosine(46)-N7)-methyltransferase TrmB n=1 Tax=Alkalinema pantanalense TaxID=1620705 RepID=UPI003D6E110E